MAADSLRDVVAVLDGAVVFFDPQLHVLACNDQFVSLFGPVGSRTIEPGTRFEDLLRQQIASGLLETPGDLPAEIYIKQTAELIRGGTAQFEMASPNGGAVRGSSVRTASGGFLLTFDLGTAQSDAELTARSMLHDAIDAVDVGIALIDNDAKLVFANRKFRTIGDPDGNLLIPGRKMRDIHSDAIDTGLFPVPPEMTGEMLLNQLDELILAAAKGFPVPNNHGSDIVGSVYETPLGGHLLTLEDVTGQRRAERLFAEAIEQLPVGVAIEEADGTLTQCNAAFAAVHGKTANELAELSRRERADLVRPAVATVNTAPFEAASTGGAGLARLMSARTLELTLKDGTHYLLERAAMDDGGHVVVVADITELKDSERRMMSVVNDVMESLDEGLALYDSNLCFVMGNKRFKEFFLADHEPLEIGEGLDRLMDRFNRADFFRTPNGMSQKDYTASLIELAQTYARDVRLETREGRLFTASSHRTELGGYLFEFADVTERRQAELELERQRNIAYQNEKLSALGELLAGIAHELNNPLSVVFGYAQMLQGKVADPVIAERVEMIGQSAERAAKIVKTFLAMARQRPARIELCSMNDAVMTALDVSSYGLRANGIQVLTDLDDAVPLVSGDFDQLAQVFSNLVVNAGHALQPQRDRGQLLVRSFHDPVSDHSVVEIRDNGPGISASVQNRIFEPFFTTKDVGEGTGIGLAFAHRIVRNHGGELEVRSSLGKGTSFFVKLRSAKDYGTETNRSDEEIDRVTRRSVLVVDDEEPVARLISDLLSEHGFAVTRTTSPHEALDLLESATFDAVLSDFKMPQMDGAGFFDALKVVAPECAERIGFITGDAMGNSVSSFLADNGRPHIEKPIVTDELLGLVNGLCAHPAEPI